MMAGASNTMIKRQIRVILTASYLFIKQYVGWKTKVANAGADTSESRNENSGAI